MAAFTWPGGTNKMLFGMGAKAPKMRTYRAVALAYAAGLGLCVSSTTARAEIRLAGASGADWTVLTVAPDGSWGTSTEGNVNRAIANAIERCRAMSAGSALGCGGYQVSVHGGWALGLRCGRETILAKGASLADAIEGARKRERELRAFYQPEMESCRQLVVVMPDGSVKVPQPQEIASGSSRDR